MLYIIIAWIIIELWMVIWMFKAKPTKEIMNKYPKKVISRAQRPFGRRWENNIAKEDIKFF